MLALFLALPLLFGACTKSGDSESVTGEEPITGEALDTGVDQQKVENSLGFEERQDGKQPPVAHLPPPPISDNCLTTAKGNPLCYLVPTLLESNIEQAGVPVHFIGSMTLKYNAEGKVTEEKIFGIQNNPNPTQVTVTGYGPDGVKNSETVTHDPNGDGNPEFTDILENVYSDNVSTLFVYKRDFPSTPDLKINYQKVYDDQDRLTEEFSYLWPPGQFGLNDRIEGFNTKYTYDGATNDVEVMDTLLYKNPSGSLYQIQTRNILALAYTSGPGDKLLESSVYYVLDCLFGVDCTGPFPLTQEQGELIYVYSTSLFNRDSQNRLESSVSQISLKDMSDRNIPPGDPSRPGEQKKITCYIWYLNSQYQVKELPKPLIQIFGDSELAPTTIACNEEGSQDWSVMRIGYQALYDAAGLPPPQ